MSRLLHSSLQPSSMPSYTRAWRLFCKFFNNCYPGVTISLQFSPPTLALFIVYMFDHNYASSTVTTYMSDLGYFHKLHGHNDPSKNFFISQMMKGYSKIDSRLDSRFPITLPLLHRIVAAASNLAEPHYNIVLFQAICRFSHFFQNR